jgi:SAM-dependent methyltransferase
MDHRSTGEYWDGNAENWTLLSRQGYDQHRDHVNTPAFLELLPEVRGLRGLDVGCGEGTNTRRVADRGADLTGIDIAPTFLAYAREREAQDPRGIEFIEAPASELPFEDGSFDFCTAFMSLMDLPDQAGALAEAHRVLRPGGFLQFSICHPCFHTRRFEWQLDGDGRRDALLVGDYFDPHWGFVEEWTFGAAPPEARDALPAFAPFKVPRFDRTLSGWLNLVLDAGFALERFVEPTPSDEVLAEVPGLADMRAIAYTLIVRCRKALD